MEKLPFFRRKLGKITENSDIIFANFRQKMEFFSKTNVMIEFLQKIVV
jgi:hypothetical protein